MSSQGAFKKDVKSIQCDEQQDKKEHNYNIRYLTQEADMLHFYNMFVGISIITIPISYIIFISFYD